MPEEQIFGGEQLSTGGGGLPDVPNLKMSECAASAMVGVDNFLATSFPTEPWFTLFSEIICAI